MTNPLKDADHPRPSEPGNRSSYGIPVMDFISHYGVESPLMQESLCSYPTLCYLLGNVTEGSPTQDNRPDGIVRPVYFLTEGSGMFGLKNPDDAMRWRGIFNHVIGTTRQVNFLSNRLKNLTEEQRNQFFLLGYNVESLDKADPSLLTDYMLVSHSGRRGADEHNWHNLNDEVHTSADPYESTLQHLQKLDAPDEIIALMRTEKHSYLLAGELPDIIDNILTYCDWTFGQSPTTLEERFEGLRARSRESLPVLAMLEGIGTKFETALKEVLGDTVIQEMRESVWDDEVLIREAYAQSAGLTLEEVFPKFERKT